MHIFLIILCLLISTPACATELKYHSIAGGENIKIPKQFDTPYIMEQPELVNISGNFYLLSLPFRLQSDASYWHVEHRAIIRFSSNFDWQKAKTYKEIVSSQEVFPRIISIYPTRQTLSVVCDRENTITETFSPQWMSASSGSITATQKADDNWTMLLELVLGSFDNGTGQVQWEYISAKNQHIPTGIMTGYAVIEIPPGQKVWVSPYQAKWLGWLPFGIFNKVFKHERVLASLARPAIISKMTLLEYAQLHNGEIDTKSAKFLSDLQMKVNK